MLSELHEGAVDVLGTQQLRILYTRPRQIPILHCGVTAASSMHLPVASGSHDGVFMLAWRGRNLASIEASARQ